MNQPTIPTDTIYLPAINYQKLVAYKTAEATILVDYKDFMHSFKPFWKQTKNRVEKLDYKNSDNPSLRNRFKFLDKTYKYLTTEINVIDTTEITEYSFQMADIGTSYHFVNKIKAGKCIILDKNRKRQTYILLQKQTIPHQSYQWSGELLFIKGERKSFTGKTLWQS